MLGRSLFSGLSARKACLLVLGLLLLLAGPMLAFTQQSAVPHLVQYSGLLSGHASGQATLTLAIYKEQYDRIPLWQETQAVAIDAEGRYTLLLGAATAEGLPADLFYSGQARWLGIQLEDGTELPRLLLSSVPYALKAADAETLGGLPATAFLHAASEGSSTTSLGPMLRVRATLSASGAAAGFLPVFSDSTGDLGRSILFQKSANLGIGTTAPAYPLSVAGVIQSSAGGFRFPDGTLQSTAFSLPANWKAAAKAGSAVLNVTDTTTGPAPLSSIPITTLSAVPAAIMGVSSGHGTTIGLLGKAGNSGSSDFGIGLLSETIGNGIGILSYNNTTPYPNIYAYDGPNAAGGNAFEADIATPTGHGFVSKFLVTPTSGKFIQVGIPGPDGGFSNSPTNFVVDGSANVSTTGGLSVRGSTALNATSVNGNLSVGGNLVVSGTINGKKYDVVGSVPAISATGAAAGYLPLFTDAGGDLGKSALFQKSANLGIGTTTPTYPLSVAGVIQSSTGGFRFPDGTTQSSAATPPVNWKAAAKSGQGVLTATNTSTGPALSSMTSSAIGTVPAGVLGASTGSGVTAGVVGQVQSSAANAFGIAVVGLVPAGKNGNAVVAWSGQGADAAFYGVNASNSGKANVYDADIYSTRGGGYRARFQVASTGPAFEVSDANNNDSFTVDRAGNIQTSGGFTVRGATYLQGQILSPVTFGNGIDVKQSSTFENGLVAKGSLSVQGDLNVSGKISKGAGSFKIDDPLDPANKTLSHSFVESPDMMNIYNGNVTTDGNGLATVELPSYFAALNRDFRYQLTVLGQFAQAIVLKEIADNRFTIQTDKPNVKVSWQVTGIRQDAYANANRIPVEEEKPEAERGTYLHPELYGADSNQP